MASWVSVVHSGATPKGCLNKSARVSALCKKHGSCLNVHPSNSSAVTLRAFYMSSNCHLPCDHYTGGRIGSAVSHACRLLRCSVRWVHVFHLRHRLS